MIARWILLAAAAAGCYREDFRAKQIGRLEAQLGQDRPALAIEAQSSDPARPDLRASFVRQSIMSMLPTQNPDRPWVAYVRIQWHFDRSDGTKVGDAIWDYVYALDREERWFKADEPTADGARPAIANSSQAP